MNYKYTLPAAIIGLSIAFVQPQVATAICSNKQVDEIAEKITVLIDSKAPGSGVIIKRQGNIYTVLTAYHVVNKPNFKYEIVTPDNQRYQLNYQTVKRLDNKIDLAILQFTSNKDYQVAKFGNSDKLIRRTNVYVAGFPHKTAGVKVSVYDCRNGQVIANATQASIDNGYNLIYDNPTLIGMSGGAVLNDQGEVIGIHGQGEESSDVALDKINPAIAIVKSGRNAGIPINTFIRLSARNGMDVGVRLPDAPKKTGLKADDYLALAADKFGKGDYKGAIVAYNEVIRLNPNNTEAFLYRGSTYYTLGDKQGAIADYNQALKINPNYVQPYINRGVARSQLGDNQGAIADFNQALKINPNFALAYNHRGNARSQLGDNQGAISDYNQALKINPNYAGAYINRGYARSDLGDKQGAIADFNQALKINPNLDLAYIGRGFVRYELGDKQGAIADYNQVLKIHPNFYLAYIIRGLARSELGDKRGAIADYNQALKINPNYANAYHNRGIAYASLGNKFQAISDLQQAVKLYQQQGGNEKFLRNAQAKIKELQQR
ncbi:serine protease [Anabaena sp. 4-3]|uniref:tetratricopeptide repeat-containing S1 family peptidase n=1 Tax=Anabaena sp. 4-3 TaxID=1811979 RepID=UPI0008309A6F|nr:serine protease [Anabaena sp. 4-3]